MTGTLGVAVRAVVALVMFCAGQQSAVELVSATVVWVL